MSRNYMSFREIHYGPYVIRLMEGDEPGYAEGIPLLVSIAGPGLPRLRLTANGPIKINDEDMSGKDGVLVFGNFKGDRPALGPSEPEPALDDRMELRIDSDLKQWVKDQGGAEYVRRLLRANRQAPSPAP